jgi:RNA polymerase sigma factor (sigma-70 family)
MVKTYKLLTHFADDKHYHPMNFWSDAPVSQSHFNDVFLAQRVILLRTLQRMVSNHSIAEDLLQETYLRVTHALSERPIAHLEPFVYQTARNLALDHLRSRRIHARTMVDDAPLSDVESVVAPHATLEDATHAKRLLEGLSASLGQLTQRQQRIFTLSRLNGCSHTEIARQLEVSPSTVQKELKLIMAICVGVATRLDHV